MGTESDGRIDRLERALQTGLGIDLAEFDDEAQAKARAKELEADEKDAEKQLEKAEKEAEKEATT